MNKTLASASLALATTTLLYGSVNTFPDQEIYQVYPAADTQASELIQASPLDDVFKGMIQSYYFDQLLRYSIESINFSIFFNSAEFSPPPKKILDNWYAYIKTKSSIITNRRMGDVHRIETFIGYFPVPEANTFTSFPYGNGIFQPKKSITVVNLHQHFIQPNTQIEIPMNLFAGEFCQAVLLKTNLRNRTLILEQETFCNQFGVTIQAINEELDYASYSEIADTYGFVPEGRIHVTPVSRTDYETLQAIMGKTSRERKSEIFRKFANDHLAIIDRNLPLYINNLPFPRTLDLKSLIDLARDYILHRIAI